MTDCQLACVAHGLARFACIALRFSSYLSAVQTSFAVRRTQESFTMVLTQSMTNVQAISGFTTSSPITRRPSRRPFTAVASFDKKSIARTAPSAVQQLLAAGAASALFLVQPAFADANLVANLSESSGPVEKLKGKFLGPQDAGSQRKALDSFTGPNTTGGFDDQGIGRQEDATIDNPNDSSRPKDRSRQGTSEAKADNLNKFAATQANTNDVETQNTK